MATKKLGLYRSAMTVEQWYGTGVTIPSIKSPNFPVFVSSCAGLVSALYTRKFGDISIHSSSCVSTAYADKLNSKIVISKDFMDGYFNALGLSDRLNSKLTVGAILGVLVHEIGHFRHTPVDGLKSFVDYVQAHTTREYNLEFARDLANIVEDIYIECALARDFPTLIWSLQSINKLMLSDDKFSAAQKHFASVTNINSANRQNIVSFLLFAKVTRNPGASVSPLIRKIFNLARSVEKTETLEQRHEIVLRLYDILMPQIDVSESESSDILENDLPEDSDSDSDLSSDSNVEDDSEDSEDDGDSGVPSDAAGDSDSERDDYQLDVQIIADDNEILEIPGYRLNSLKPGTLEIQSNGYIVRNIMTGVDKPLEMDIRYNRLVEIARQRANATRPLGTPRNNGNNIRGLERIITDGRIFADKSPSSKFLPMDIMIVIDCSGSMRGYKFSSAVRQALGCAMALITARCSVQVYGHTSDGNHKKDIGIFKFLGTGEPINLLAQRLGHMENYSYAMAANRDGYALEYLATKLPKMAKQRLMLVISDGRPSASNPDYEYEFAILHTQSVVDKIREEGIMVKSISIDTHAFEANNRIYGGSHNINSTAKDALDILVKQILMN